MSIDTRRCTRPGVCVPHRVRALYGFHFALLTADSFFTSPPLPSVCLARQTDNLFIHPAEFVASRRAASISRSSTTMLINRRTNGQSVGGTCPYGCASVRACLGRSMQLRFGSCWPSEDTRKRVPNRVTGNSNYRPQIAQRSHRDRVESRESITDQDRLPTFPLLPYLAYPSPSDSRVPGKRPRADPFPKRIYP